MSVSPLVVEILKKRGITNIDEYLYPDYDSISNPFTMHGMQQAVERITEALHAQEKIAIYSDYDADGIPGAVILSDTLRMLRHDNFVVYIPHRHNEGYGLHTHAIDSLAEGGVSLIITCDLGITSVKEVAYARERRVDMIVTDHHESDGDQIPDCIVVHPKLGSYNDPMICGCAVAYQLVRALVTYLRQYDDERVDRIPDGYEKWMLDLVGMSTIADMVPLVNENRILATYGMRVLRQTRRPGLRMLAAVSGANLLTGNEEIIGFNMVPCINAASRMEHPMLAYELLAERDPTLALERANYLKKLNTKRRSVVDEIMKTAHLQALSQQFSQILWVGDDAWNVGVLSIIAGRLVDAYQKPVFVWAGYNDDLRKGSVRGTGNVDMLEVMTSAPDHIFKKRGGHKNAGGFTIYKEYEADFLKYLDGITFDNGSTVKSENEFDSVLSLNDISESLLRDIEIMRPFGVGNTMPQFQITARVAERKMFGKTLNHEKILLIDENTGKRVWILAFSGEREKFSNWLVGSVQSGVFTIEESGQGRWREIVLRPV